MEKIWRKNTFYERHWLFTGEDTRDQLMKGFVDNEKFSCTRCARIFIEKKDVLNQFSKTHPLFYFMEG